MHEGPFAFAFVIVRGEVMRVCGGKKVILRS